MYLLNPKFQDWLVCVAEQVGLTLTWSQTPEGSFCFLDVAHLFSGGAALVSLTAAPFTGGASIFAGMAAAVGGRVQTNLIKL